MKRNILTIGVVCTMLVGVVEQRALAASPKVCRSTTGPEICVQFDNLAGAPEETFDFDFSFDGSGIPSVDLIQGDNGLGTTYQWRVWSWDNDTNESPRDIGSITGIGAEDYEVMLLQPDNDAGAVAVALINLDPTDAANYSNLAAGKISGDLDGNLTLQRSSGGTGGELDLTVYGDVDGDISAYAIHDLEVSGAHQGDITATTCDQLEIGGNSTGTITIETVNEHGDVTIDGERSGWLTIGTLSKLSTLTIYRLLSGTPQALKIDLIEERVTVWLLEGMSSAAKVKIGHITPPNSGHTFLRFGSTAAPNVEGELYLAFGIPEDVYVWIHGRTTASAVISLDHKDIRGELMIQRGGSVEIRDVGVVYGSVYLTKGLGGNFDYSGSATFANVAAGGSIETYFGHLYGPLVISEAMAGTIGVGTGPIGRNLAYNGLIQVGTDCSGDITVSGDAAGHVDILGDLSGDLDIGGGVTSDIDIGGDLTGNVLVGEDAEGDINVGGSIRTGASVAIGGQLTSEGRVRIDGTSDGPITIGEATGTNTLIRVTDGLAANATIVINDSEGNFNADGDIYIGDPKPSIPPPPVTFDGKIVVNDNVMGWFGSLIGDITVVGCHSQGHDDLDICIFGGVSGTVSIVETECDYPGVDYCCGGGTCQ